MQSPLGIPSHQGGENNGELALTGSQVSVTRRSNSAGSAKHISRSISVITDTRSRGNQVKDSPRAINNLRRSNSTTQVTPGDSSLLRDQHDDFLAFFESSSVGRKKLHGLAKTPPEKKTTWNILDDQPRAFPIPSSARSASSVPSLSIKKRDMPTLAPNFPANNRSNKGAVGNTVTTMVHNNYSSSDRGLAAKSSNQKPSSLNNQRKPKGEESESSYQKSQKNLSSTNNLGHNNAGGSSTQRRKEVTAEEAERFILQVNNAAITIQRWYRRQRQTRRSGEEALRYILASKKEEQRHKADEGSYLNSYQSKEEDRKRIREEKARQARRAAIQELHLKRAQKALEAQKLVEEELALLEQSGKVGRKKVSRNLVNSPLQRSKSNNNTGSRVQDMLENENSLLPLFKPSPDYRSSEHSAQTPFTPDQGRGEVDVAISAHSKTTLTDLLDTLKVLEETEPLVEIRREGKDKFHWMDGDADTSLTADNLERHSQLTLNRQVDQKEVHGGAGALLSEAKLQNIISFLDEMEKAEQERPRSSGSNAHRGPLLSEEELNHLEQASAVATEVTSSMLKMRLELEEKKKAMSLLQTALEMKKLQELMTSTEKVRRDKWIDEKTKKIKEITVKGLEPEIQRLISKHKQEIRKLKALHEAELLQSDERAAQRYVRQAEELRQNLEREKEEGSQRERELAKQRYEKQLVQEEQSLQEQRRRLYSEVSEEKERLKQQAARQRAELDELRKQLEDNCALSTRVLKEEYEKSKEEQERRHQIELKAIKERVEIEKQAWEQNYRKKELQDCEPFQTKQ
ncbi:hypothetical protein GDO78_004014 [Eleutherodactylus coqui]|uniref:Uncharacterized protein n=1 Tax=Eleutherodactylus coqui TaxID=57060 RepID=A0A8J6EQU9_ELECQ|nr:hypothetical protein GDO78_004014 [Eleutherodactylus coqui]